MQGTWQRHSIKLVVLLLIQVLILRQVPLGGGWLPYGEVFIYPLFVLTLPLRMHGAFIIMAAFVCGITVDLFYDTPGVHAGASVLTAYARPLILSVVEPRTGYDITDTLKRDNLGTGWFISYVSLFFLIHIFVVQIFTFFTFYHFDKVVFSTLLSWLLSVLVVVLQDFILKPKS